jgi:hypothetical protein
MFKIEKIPKLLESFQIFEPYENIKVQKFQVNDDTIIYTDQKDYLNLFDSIKETGVSLVVETISPGHWKNIVDNIYHSEETYEPEKLGDFKDEIDQTKLKYKNVWFQPSKNV